MFVYSSTFQWGRKEHSSLLRYEVSKVQTLLFTELKRSTFSTQQGLCFSLIRLGIPRHNCLSALLAAGMLGKNQSTILK